MASPSIFCDRMVPLLTTVSLSGRRRDQSRSGWPSRWSLTPKSGQCQRHRGIRGAGAGFQDDLGSIFIDENVIPGVSDKACGHGFGRGRIVNESTGNTWSEGCKGNTHTLGLSPRRGRQVRGIDQCIFAGSALQARCLSSGGGRCHSAGQAARKRSRHRHRRGIATWPQC